jgi:RecB family endonuclease NucS
LVPLPLDENDHFVIIELKKGKAPDKVVAQVDRYMTAVQQRLAKRDQEVRGIIIANRYDSHFRDILKQRNNIDFWQFEWQGKLNKRPRPIDA